MLSFVTSYTCLSGGGSALLPAPIPPVTLPELVDVTRLLARGGATIYQLNTIRKHLELMKGGGLAKAAYPAKVKHDRSSFCCGCNRLMISSIKCVVTVNRYKLTVIRFD